MDILSSQGRCGAPVLNLAPHPFKQQMVAFQYLGSDSKTISEGSQISQAFFPFLSLGLPYLKDFTWLKLSSQHSELWKKKLYSACKEVNGWTPKLGELFKKKNERQHVMVQA